MNKGGATTYPVQPSQPKKRRFVVGDIHGAHRALLQVFERSGFRYETDQLICIGDVADGWSEVPQCFDELLAVKDMIYILGNHDEWLYNWFVFQHMPNVWIFQGGRESVKAYREKYEGDRDKHMMLLKYAKPYHVIKDVEEGIARTKLFVHGGYDWHRPIEETSMRDMIWDRHLWQTVLYWKDFEKRDFYKIKDYDEVFIGHTTTSRADPELKPVQASNVWNVDQGAGWEGKLTLMDIDTKEYWQSDLVSELYPDEKGRRG
jgi:serine/threonine protein phosphatase 1